MPFLPLGGQAVIEGVMMRSPTRVAVAVRRPDGSLAFLERTFESVTRRHKLLGLPVVRGAVSLFETLALGTTALNFSADEASREETPKGGASAPAAGMAIAQLVTVAVSLTLGVLLFVVAPARLTEWLGFHDRVRFGLVDGALRLTAFVLYLWLISRWARWRACSAITAPSTRPSMRSRRACRSRPRTSRRSRACTRAAAPRSCSSSS
jgi:uncharacterized protein YqhQ